MEPMRRIIGAMPYSVDEGVGVTVDWMRREGWIPWESRVRSVEPPLPRLYPIHLHL